MPWRISPGKGNRARFFSFAKRKEERLSIASLSKKIPSDSLEIVGLYRIYIIFEIERKCIFY